MGRMSLKQPAVPPIAVAIDGEIQRLDDLALYGWIGTSALVLILNVATLLLLRDFHAGTVLVPAAAAVWFAIIARLRAHGRGRWLHRWVSPAVESAFPWAALALLSKIEGPAYALGSWVPPLLYACVMCVGILRLRPGNPLLLGALGAVEYALLYFFFLRQDLTPSEIDLPLFGAKMQMVRCGSVFLGGVLCSALSYGLRRAIGNAATTVRERDLFGKYRLERPIASGGMATVYAATYCPEGGFERPVAVKRIHPHLAKVTSFVDGFRNEAELCARLVHPNIVQVFDFGRVDETYFLAMEFVDGTTLNAMMRSRQKLNKPILPRLVAWIGREMLEGLAYSHGGALDAAGGLLRVVHRDLSPSNVLVSKNGEVKLSDFGLARALRSASAYVTDNLAGHLSYMAPEQARGHETDERSDLFAIAVILWEMLTGVPLFKREFEGATLLAIVNDAVPAPSTLRAGLSPLWDVLFRRGVERDPKLRFQCARDMADALTEILDEEGAPEPGELGKLVSQVLADPKARSLHDEVPTAHDLTLDATEVRQDSYSATLFDSRAT